MPENNINTTTLPPETQSPNGKDTDRPALEDFFAGTPFAIKAESETQSITDATIISEASDNSCLPVTSAAVTSAPALLESISQSQNLPQSVTEDIFSLDTIQPFDANTFPQPPRPGSNQLACTVANTRYLLEKCNIKPRYNVISKKIEIGIPGLSGSADNRDNVAMTHLISLAALHGMPIGQVPANVEAIADENTYNPVAMWINSKPWDGKDRLMEIYQTLTVREGYSELLKIKLLYRWLLSAVAAALSDTGFKARGVLTLQGDQGLGKTTWVTSLVPEGVLRDMLIKVDHHLDGSDKDSIIGAIQFWIVEIGELDSSFKKDVSRLKGFLTSSSDRVRRPYARTESAYSRRTIFFASVNQSDFLVDMTGNSRWWTIPITKINYNHGIDTQQLFAQLAEDFKQGEQWWLIDKENDLLDRFNDEHLSTSVIRDKLMEFVDMQLRDNPDNPAMSGLDVIKMIGIDYPTNGQSKECAGVLRGLFGESKRINGTNKWRIPLRDKSSFSGQKANRR